MVIMEPKPPQPSGHLTETVAQQRFISSPLEDDISQFEGSILDSMGVYQIIRKLAEGGMGIIFLGLDCKLHRKIACKILKVKYLEDQGLRLRFNREALIMGNLHHPGIVPIYNQGNLPDSRPFFTMR